MHFLLTAFTFPHCTPFFHSFTSFFPFHTYSRTIPLKKADLDPGPNFPPRKPLHRVSSELQAGNGLSIDLYIKLATMFIREHDQTELVRVQSEKRNSCEWDVFLHKIPQNFTATLNF